MVVVVVVVDVVVGFVKHTFVSESNLQVSSTRHSFDANLKHGSGFSVVVVVVVVVTGTAQDPAPVLSNTQPVAKQFFFRNPAHGLKSAHCRTPFAEPKTHAATALHFFRLRPSHTLPLPSALRHVLDALSNKQPSIFLHARPLRPLQTLGKLNLE